MATAYRIVERKWSGTAFDGDGARIAPGRWNSRGMPMVYLAETLPGAILEILVHLDDWDALLRKYVYFAVEVPERDIRTVLPRRLPRGWDRVPFTPASQLYGDGWISGQKSLALRVPSVVVRPAHPVFNLLLNPLHPRISSVAITGPKRIEFDERLLAAGR